MQEDVELSIPNEDPTPFCPVDRNFSRYREGRVRPEEPLRWEGGQAVMASGA